MKKNLFRIRQFGPRLTSVFDVNVLSQSVDTALIGVKAENPKLIGKVGSISIFQDSGWLYLVSPL